MNAKLIYIRIQDERFIKKKTKREKLFPVNIKLIIHLGFKVYYLYAYD